MWVVRESLRLVGRIAFAVLVAIVIAEIRAIVSGGDTFRTFRMVLMLLGAAMLLLAAAPNTSLGGRRVDHQGWWLTESLGFGKLQHVQGPKLTATAVFIFSGVVCLVLGAVA